jgi:hypothetical protein
LDRASGGHGACVEQGGGGGRTLEQWVDGEGGTWAEAVVLVGDEPQKVAGSDGEGILQLRTKEREVRRGPNQRKRELVWCSPERGRWRPWRPKCL